MKKSVNRYHKQEGRKAHFVLALAGFALVLQFVLAAVFFDTGPQAAPEPPAKAVAAPLLDAPEPPKAQAKALSAPLKPRFEVVEKTLSPGQTAAQIFQGLLGPAEVHAMDMAAREVHPLTRLRAGQPYRIKTLKNAFEAFEYEIDQNEVLVIRKKGEEFEVSLKPIDYDVRTVVVSGTVDNNLFAAVSESGETPELAIRIADVFAWDVDFCRDIRPGDSFRAVVEKRYRDGEFAGYGKLFATQFTNQDKRFRGFRFEDEEGRFSYFDEQGKSLRKVFLKAPLSFTRISSGFSYSRLHPILKYRRPHTGVDYAAPTGTPVWSIGDGKVVARGYSKGAGRYVKVRHNSVYTTQYNHLSRFAKGSGVGQAVSQKQVIGYVGSTGLATGPHLDFRLYKNGSAINPRSMKAPPAEPVEGKRMNEYLASIEPLREILDRSEAGPVRLAQRGL